ncbi:MAG: NADH-quinone oxidoreductase subunit N [Halobacteria archaeon]
MDYAIVAPELLLVIFALIIPLIGLFAVKDNAKVLGGLGLIALLAAFALTMQLIGVDQTLFEVYKVDYYSLFFKMVFLTVGILVAIASILYVGEEPHQAEYYSLLLLATVGMMVVASASDLITLFVGLELASLSTYALAAFVKRDPQCSEAAMKYFLIGALSSALALYGISLIYGITGTTNLILAAKSQAILAFEPVGVIAAVFLIAGFGFKMAAVPFHMWAPDTYHGEPTTVSAFLAAGSKKMGFAAAFKIFIIALIAIKANWTLLFGIIAAITMTLGNVVAVAQTSIKRMLAYSSIGQAGYIMVGLAVATPLGIASGLLQAFAHGIMKAGAFIAAAAVTYMLVRDYGSKYRAQTDGGEISTDDIEAYAGLGKRAPITAFCMLIFLLSLAGVPPLFGFVSKFWIVMAAIQAGGYAIWLAVILVLNSALSVYYYVRVIRYMYVVPAREAAVKGGEPAAFTVPLVIATIALFALGLFPDRIVDFAMNAARAIIP